MVVMVVSSRTWMLRACAGLLAIIGHRQHATRHTRHIYMQSSARTSGCEPEVVEQGQQDDEERVDGAVGHEDEDGQHGHDLDRRSETVDHVGLELAEDAGKGKERKGKGRGNGC